MDLLVRKQAQRGFTPIVNAGQQTAGIDFGLLSLQKDEEYSIAAGGKEYAAVILGGRCDIRGDDFGWKHAGGRRNVFDGTATAFYLPPAHNCRITARTPLLVALAAAESSLKCEPVFIEPDDIHVREVGKDNYRRQVHDIFDVNRTAGRLIVGETFSPPGNWSSYPPHRHERDNNEAEAQLEEVYFFRIHPQQGFAIQRVYTDNGEIDEMFCVRDGDLVMIPRGYHPVVAAPGYRLYYLWVLAGKRRQLFTHLDPQHQWIDAPRP